jgi:hypothetical protein
LELGGLRAISSRKVPQFNGFDVNKEQRLYNERVEAQAYIAWRHAQKRMPDAQEP